MKGFSLWLVLTVVLVIAMAMACGDDDEADPVPPEVANNQNQWPLPNHDYANTRAAVGAEINSENVGELGIAWSFDIPGQSTYGSAATNPLIADGVVYFQDLASNVFAIRLDSGELVWEQRYEERVVGPNGPAIGWGKVFAPSGIDSFAALDIETGDQLWENQVDEPTGAHQPSVYGGFVYGATQAGAVITEASPGEELAVRGYAGGTSGVIYALDEESGDIGWQFQVVEEGFWGNTDVNSGGGVWYPPAIDTNSGITFWGTGNPAPFPGTVDFPNGSSRPGPELYANSIVALQHDTGDLLWFNHVKPEDLFDLDFQAPRILATETIAGQERDIVIGSGKLGRIMAFQREDGSLIWDTPVGRHANDELRGIPPGETIEVYPGILGGVETPMAYADGIVYAAVVNMPTPYTADGFGAEDGTEALINAEQRTNLEEGTGEIVAVDATTGLIAWTHSVDSLPFGGVTVVNDLLFSSTFDGSIFALDRESGEEVWTLQAPAGINAWPAVAGDSIIFAAGAGDQPQLIALSLGAEQDRTSTPTPSPTATPGTSPTETPEAMATATASPTETSTPAGEAVQLDLTAANIAFDEDTLTVPVGAMVTMTFTNNDQVPHNFALYTDDSASESIFVGETFSGPGETRTYEFQAPSQLGTYFFRCDVHPTQMTGDFMVQ
jgi:outer membrane protein assembly factor BamB/plastocyanin